MRDLRKDLEICEATYEGPWLKDGLFIVNADKYIICDTVTMPDVQNFITEARTGWPEAINRALMAEEMLRDVISNHNILRRDIIRSERDNLRAENERLREVLGFYAKPSTYKKGHDWGQKARATLEVKPDALD